MNRPALLCACLYVATAFGAPLATAAAPQPQAESPVGRWYQSLPGWGCEAAPFPKAYQVNASIGPDADSYLGTFKFKMYPEFSSVWRIGAVYDATHRAALFYDSDGNELRQYHLVAAPMPPPIPVGAKDLSGLAMGGKVHLGDTLEKVRVTLRLPATLHLTPMQRCKFHDASAYSAAVFYGPPHVPPVPAKRNTCAAIGPDIKIGQTLGTVIFRDNRVAVLVWQMCGA